MSDIGRSFLNSDDCGFISGEDGDSYRYSDGGGYFHGRDGSEGYIYSDGSGYFHGADGSDGYIYSDGSAYFHGADGSDGYKYSDGSGYYHGADGSDGYRYTDGSGYFNAADGSSVRYDATYNDDVDDEIGTYDDQPSSFAESMGELLAGAILGGAAVVTAAASKKIAEEIEQEAQHEVLVREKKLAAEQKRKAWRYEHRKLLRFIRFIIIIAILVGIGYFEYLNLSPVGYSSSELTGIYYKETTSMLKESGFTWIIEKSESDLSYNERGEENRVTSVKIGVWDDFDADMKYPTNLPVIITYHTVESVHMPFSSKEIKGMNYEDVVYELELAGFGNIKCQAQEGLISGLLNEEGEVVSITVGEVSRFSTDDSFRADERIVIEYYSKGD